MRAKKTAGALLFVMATASKLCACTGNSAKTEQSLLFAICGFQSFTACSQARAQHSPAGDSQHVGQGPQSRNAAKSAAPSQSVHKPLARRPASASQSVHRFSAQPGRSPASSSAGLHSNSHSAFAAPSGTHFWCPNYLAFWHVQIESFQPAVVVVLRLS